MRHTFDKKYIVLFELLSNYNTFFSLEWFRSHAYQGHNNNSDSSVILWRVAYPRVAYQSPYRSNLGQRCNSLFSIYTPCAVRKLRRVCNIMNAEFSRISRRNLLPLNGWISSLHIFCIYWLITQSLNWW